MCHLRLIAAIAPHQAAVALARGIQRPIDDDFEGLGGLVLVLLDYLPARAVASPRAAGHREAALGGQAAGLGFFEKFFVFVV